MTFDKDSYAVYLRAKRLAEKALEVHVMKCHGLDSQYQERSLKSEYDELAIGKGRI